MYSTKPFPTLLTELVSVTRITWAITLHIYLHLIYAVLVRKLMCSLVKQAATVV